MKKITMLLFLSTLVSCSNDNSMSTNTEDVSVASIIRKNYNGSTGAVLSTIEYTIGNNKIMSVTASNAQNSPQSVSVYSYLNNKITQITTSSNGVVTSTSYYIYNSANQLIEYRTEGSDSAGQLYINKNTFERIQDTIYNHWTRKTPSSNDFFPIQSSKIVLDQNFNRTYFEYYDHLNNQTGKKIITYDAQSNILEEKSYLMDEFGQFQNTITNNYSYGTAKNTLSYVMLATFGKENMTLLYDLQTRALNEFIVKSYSPNVLTNFTSTFSNVTFTITNTINNTNFCDFSEYICISGPIFSKFTYQFTFN